ncbi:prolyl oligopeptidase family serine peptidase [Fictibacillus enclensis]|uniref:carboxylesterase family protein n=1 Tax=Fictibacillus enclensis TaxID=1017270 RepID=UPI0025A30161|nr:prolyl oligopeptidase family serine peptidase [Fictibacillus enclensis]MDM5337090.1 prolyl oligopeptidase family serine peptidase [Fictibacillus enclensis]
MALEPHQFTEKTRTLPFLLSKPKRYEAEESWPLILFLHGMGERGTDLNLIKHYGIPRTAADDQSFPFITVSPQCPGDSYWTEETDTLKELITQCILSLKVDPARVYVTGLSMGGAGTWKLAIEYPDLFAAAAPVCGTSFPEKADRLAGLPVWVFHGDKDDVVPVACSTSMVQAMEQNGMEARLTIYPDTGHDAWTETYQNQTLYSWFLENRR